MNVNDLTDFLLARIAEDEAWAKDCQNWAECGAGPWEGTGETYGCPAHPSTSRRIAECDSKRLVVDLVEPYLVKPEQGGWDDVSSREWHNAEQTLQLLALPYAQHPNYKQEWKP